MANATLRELHRINCLYDATAAIDEHMMSLNSSNLQKSSERHASVKRSKINLRSPRERSNHPPQLSHFQTCRKPCRPALSPASATLAIIYRNTASTLILTCLETVVPPGPCLLARLNIQNSVCRYYHLNFQAQSQPPRSLASLTTLLSETLPHATSPR